MKQRTMNRNDKTKYLIADQQQMDAMHTLLADVWDFSAVLPTLK